MQFLVETHLAYINDMPGTVTSSEIELFADDSFLFRTINNQHDSDLLQRDLTTLEDWENKWQMSFKTVPWGYTREYWNLFGDSSFKYNALLSVR
jgi:hypothetical protein